jgi:predicted metal-dependent hydrolase
LILAEPEILNYVVCHEVAHLLEHNHSQRFWKLVESLCPHWRASREWLKQHGKLLYAYGLR